MTALDRKFNAAEVPPEQRFGALPTGNYRSIITGSRWKTTKAGDGRYLEFEFSVEEPAEHANRKFWSRLNLENPNPTAVAIAEKQLSAICHAVGVLEVDDAEALHNRPLMVRVKLRPETDFYPESNDVQAYSPVSGSSTSKAKAPLFSAKNARTPGTMPWDKDAPVLPEDHIPF